MIHRWMSLLRMSIVLMVTGVLPIQAGAGVSTTVEWNTLRALGEGGDAEYLQHPEAIRQLYLRYFRSTYASLECLRGRTGLINDRMDLELINGSPLEQNGSTAACPLKSTATLTSPTNIGFDLLSQLAAIHLGLSAPLAKMNIRRIIDAVAVLPRHSSSHLLYSLYSTDVDTNVIDRNISSVDNIHLALALWSVAQNFPGETFGLKARKIFASMDFSIFYHPDSGLIGGQLEYHKGGWTLAQWSYSFYGSEARSISSLGFALGLLKDRDFRQKNPQAFAIEDFDWIHGGRSCKILRTWDGGAFQLLLPQILIGEADYSPELRARFYHFSDFILWKQAAEHLSTPAAFSASQAGEQDVSCGPSFGCYNGKAGILDLVATSDHDQSDPSLRAQWEATFTPHAAVLAATMMPNRFARILKGLERISSAQGPLYDPKLGWMDGFRLKSPYASSVIPVQLALDQEIILLSLSSILSPDHLSPSARALARNPTTHARLADYYEQISRRLRAL